MLASQIARYSSVKGGCCARPGRLFGSKEPPPIRSQAPPQSGYLPGVCANAGADAAMTRAAAMRLCLSTIGIPNLILRFDVERLGDGGELGHLAVDGGRELGRGAGIENLAGRGQALLDI